MKRALLILALITLALQLRAEPYCVDGMCYPDEAAYQRAMIKRSARMYEGTDGFRIATGSMSAEEMIAFIKGEKADSPKLADKAPLIAFLLILMAGVMMNLTPCVLPLVPVTLALIGRRATNGIAYGIGIALSFGALGLAAAFGAVMFGALQSSWHFNACAAIFFVYMAAVMSGLLMPPRFLRSSRLQPGTATPVRAFLLGGGVAVLASACVEPMLFAVLALTAELVAKGKQWGVVLPFVLGLGMALPWPFAAAGMKAFPKAGTWMIWVKRLFSLFLVVLASRYAYLAWSATHPSAKVNTSINQGAKKTFVKVGAKWCTACAVMDKTVFKDERVKAALKDFTFTEMEIERPEELKKLPGFGKHFNGLPLYFIYEKPKETVAE